MPARKPSGSARLGILAATLGLAFLSSAQKRPGVLKLTFVEQDSRQPTPVRVELLDSQGIGHIADDALPVNGDCTDRLVPADLTLERAIGVLDKKIIAPHTNHVQFYSTGKSELSLPSGDYKLKAQKGPEYVIQRRDVHIEPGQTEELSVTMSRWVNQPAQGWYSADDHLHIARPVQELNPLISKWMQAEDVHVANLLQWGSSRVGSFHNTLQYAFAKDGIYREGDYILATGQENPRTHFLGHVIVLGAKTPINYPEAYVIYLLFLEEAHRQGALSGYAHFATANANGGQFGIGIVLPAGLLNFVEVLQLDRAVYDVWYDVLNTGFRMTPTAGTDYPCGGKLLPGLPGSARFYTKVEGKFHYETWIEGIRRGRTFVTNGVMLEFHVNDKDVGEEVLVKKGTSVSVKGSARFEPSRDVIDRLEVIQNGDILRSFPRKGESSEISFQFDQKVEETSWVALRASGKKLHEGLEGPGAWLASTSVGHTAPIYLTLQNAPPLTSYPRTKVLGRKWLALLDDLEMRLAEDQYKYLSGPPLSNQGVGEEDLGKNRAALIKSIESAKKYFLAMSR